MDVALEFLAPKFTTITEKKRSGDTLRGGGASWRW